MTILSGPNPAFLACGLTLLAAPALAGSFTVLEATRDLPAAVRALHQAGAGDCRDKPAAIRPRVETFMLDDRHVAFLIFCHDDGLNAVRYGYVASGPGLREAAPLTPPRAADGRRTGRLEGYYTWDPRQRRLHLWTFLTPTDCTRHQDWQWSEGGFQVAGGSLDCGKTAARTGGIPQDPPLLVREQQVD